MTGTLKMAQPKEKKKMRPAHTLHFSVDKYPDVLAAGNELSIILDRKPHDAVRTFLKAVKGNLPEIIKLCRERGAAI